MNNKYFKPLDYKMVDRKIAYNGKRLKVEEVNYIKGDKKIYREHVIAGDASVILAIKDNGNLVMIQEPRSPINKVILGLPAGQIEQNESAEDGARRELEEETGYYAKNIKKLREYYSSVGYTDEKISIFLATDLIKTERNLDEGEDIEVVEISLKEAKEMLDKNEIITASTTIALMHFFLYCENDLTL